MNKEQAKTMRKRFDNMIQRCYNVNVPGYKNYGARGISVCERWRHSFQAFCEDLGECPAPGMSMDRINNDGNYEPGNVRWATSKQQMANKRPGGKPRKYGAGSDQLCVPMSISVPDEILSILDGYADARRVSRSAAAVSLIVDGLNRLQSPQPPSE